MNNKQIKLRNFVDFSLLKAKKSKKTIIMYSRASVILPSFINQTFNIHNGKIFIKLKIKKPMVGYKFGSFVQTKNNAQYKKWLKK